MSQSHLFPPNHSSLASLTLVCKRPTESPIQFTTRERWSALEEHTHSTRGKGMLVVRVRIRALVHPQPSRGEEAEALTIAEAAPPSTVVVAGGGGGGVRLGEGLRWREWGSGGNRTPSGRVGRLGVGMCYCKVGPTVAIRGACSMTRHRRAGGRPETKCNRSGSSSSSKKKNRSY